MGGMFTHKTATQSEQQQQTAVQGGGSGSVTTALGANSTRNAVQSAGALTGDLGINASGEAHVAITTNDPAAAIKALEVNQEISTQAISYANINANTALETLQMFGHELSTIASGNSVAQVPNLPPVNPSSTEPVSHTKLYVGLAVTVVIVIASIIIFTKKSA